MLEHLTLNVNVSMYECICVFAYISDNGRNMQCNICISIYCIVLHVDRNVCRRYDSLQ